MATHIEMPMNTANHHGANAEDYYARGLFVPAAEEHDKAAEALLAAIERSNDESAKRTLRMLHNKHIKDRDDLRRRIQKLRDEGKDPNLPQVPQRQADAAPHSHRHPTTASNAQDQSTMSSQQRPMSDSHNTVDESFMVLGGQRSDPGDAFNQFWNVLQGMLDNISQPVAFATAPLGELDNPAELQPKPDTPPPVHVYGGITGKERAELRHDSTSDETYLSKWSKRIGLGNLRGSTSASSSVHAEDIDDFLEEGGDLSGSFCVVPSGAEPTSLVLQKENSNLKAELIVMQDKLKATEHLLKPRREQDMHLRTSIFEAQRAMSASGMLPPRQTGPEFGKSPGLAVSPIPTMKAGREAQYTKRIKELEDELRLVRSENEKNKLMIVKFRERWEKLKESAKRKKEAKASSEGVRNQKIVEEPEAEEELDGTK